MVWSGRRHVIFLTDRMESMEQTKVALLGVGLMGTGMGGRLLDAGYSLTVYNRTPEKARALVERGAGLAKTPAEAAAGAEIVLSMLADDDASRRVWLGDAGALAAAAPNATLVESSTVTVAWIRELESAARKRGLALVDAPVTGSKMQAAAGQLLFLAGGPQETVARITPVLQAMGRGIVYLGASGNGARMKLINNFMCAVQVASLAEAVGLIERSGLEPAKAVAVLVEGAPGSPMVKGVAGRMMTREHQPHFALRLMAKDLRYALAEGRQHGETLATAATALGIFERAIAAGDGDLDLSSVVKLFRAKDQ